MAEGLDVTVDGPVIRAVIDRGDANLLTTAMCEELTELLATPPPGAHVLRLAARGPSFCLGRERRGRSLEELRHEVTALVGLNRALRKSPLVTLAEVQGDAAGFGVGLATLCRVSVAAPSKNLMCGLNPIIGP